MHSWSCAWLVVATLTALAPPAAAQSPNTPRIVAIGDLHGDYAAWRDIALDARLIDAQGRWTGAATVLVQAGDVADRGPDSRKIIEDLMRLQREAPRTGGRVVALVGNHEAMNVTDDLRYVSAGEYAAFADRDSARLRQQVYTANRAAIEATYRQHSPAMTSAAIAQAWLAATPRGLVEHQKAWHPDGKIGRWVTANPAVLLLGGTLFVHGGLSAAYAHRALEDINRSVAAALATRDTGDDAILDDPLGPLWYRGLAATPAANDSSPAENSPPSPVAAPPLAVEAELDLVLRTYGATRMVIAHTPILTGIALLYGGRLARIDTGISAVYGGKLTYLEIIDGDLVPHSVPRSVPAQQGAK